MCIMAKLVIVNDNAKFVISPKSLLAKPWKFSIPALTLPGVPDPKLDTC